MTIDEAIFRFEHDIEFLNAVCSHKTKQIELYEMALKGLKALKREEYGEEKWETEQ